VIFIGNDAVDEAERQRFVGFYRATAWLVANKVPAAWH
jgi:hypothetical protein